MTFRPTLRIAGAALAVAAVGAGLAGCKGSQADGGAARSPSVTTPTRPPPTQGQSVPTAPTVDTRLPEPGLISTILPRPQVRPVATTNVAVTTTTTTRPPVCGGFTLLATTFRTNEATLTAAAAKDLDDLAKQLRSKPGRINVSGHTDPRMASYPGGNEALSHDRASVVVRALEARGIPASRFGKIEGLAATVLVDLGTSEDAYQRNRRVELVLECP